ncbi:MAG: hypothetical protein GEU74_07150 [Nitriliruptorales bacterium]|nr:hypothetical protein [Nitriliruptorales bacterium]
MAENLDDLFLLPPSEFTAARDALGKRLRAEGRPEDAKQVKGLRRPTMAAWALNQVAHNHPDAVDGLVAAGAEVAAAQRRALSGVRDAGLREASQQRRARVDDVWDLAAAVLRDAGADPASHRQAIADTLDAASVDGEAADALRAGHLTRELPAPSGFGAVTGFALVPPADEPVAPLADTAEDDREEAVRRALEEARRHAADAQEEADGLERRAGDARQAAVRTVAEAQRLEARAHDLRVRADTLTEDADEMTGRAAAARAAADGAVARLRDLEAESGP